MSSPSSNHLPTSEQVIEAVSATGFLLEQEVYRTLLSYGYSADVSVAFIDPDEQKSREVDVLGTKRYFRHESEPAGFKVQLIIECKNPKWPYVVVGRNATAAEQCRKPFGAQFWSENITIHNVVRLRSNAGGDRLGCRGQGRSVESLVPRRDPSRRTALQRLPRNEGGVMKGVPWEEAKRRAREIDPEWDSPERIAARKESRERMRAEQRGH